MQEIIRNSWLVSAKGGLIDFVEDGEVLFQAAVPPGRHSANEYLDLCPDGAEMQVSKGLAVIWPKANVIVQPNPLAVETSANPDFIATGAAAEQRRLALTIGLMQQSVNDQIEARMAGLSLIEPVKPVQGAVSGDPDPEPVADDAKP